MKAPFRQQIITDILKLQIIKNSKQTGFLYPVYTNQKLSR